MSEKYLTCGTCANFIGGGDWNLCCTKKYDLCYRRTKACGMYEFSQKTVDMLEQRDRELAEYIRNARKGKK